MMSSDEILDAAAIKIAEVQRQRDRARRQLSRARALLKQIMLHHTADMEAVEDENDPTLKAWARAERFLARTK